MLSCTTGECITSLYVWNSQSENEETVKLRDPSKTQSICDPLLPMDGLKFLWHLIFQVFIALGDS